MTDENHEARAPRRIGMSLKQAEHFLFMSGEHGKAHKKPLPPVCLSPLGLLRLSHEKPFVKTAREQYESAEKKRSSRVLLKRWARFGAFAMDEVTKELEEMKEKGLRALSPYESDPQGYERQVMYSLQVGLFYLCFPRQQEEELACL